MKLRIALATCGLSMMPTLGFAQAQHTGPLTVSYRAPAACRDGQMFVDLVHVSAPAVSLELSRAPDDQAADVAVVVREVVGGFAGTLQIRRNDDARYFRELEASGCDELATALAFVAALALTGQGEPSLEQTQPPAVAPSPVAPARRESAPVALAAIEPPPAAASKARWGFGGALALGIRTGLGPTWANMEQSRLSFAR